MSEKAQKQRQKLLKRVVPALAVAVAYGVFFAPGINANAVKAAAEVERMKQQYAANRAKLAELAQKKKDVMEELNKLRQQGMQSDAETVRYTGFIGQPDYAAQAIGRLSEVFGRHRLRIIEDGKQDWAAGKDSLPELVKQFGEPAKAAKTKGGEAGTSLWRVRFSGAYLDVYRALDELAADSLKIIPVSLDMAAPEDGGDLLWTVRIWI